MKWSRHPDDQRQLATTFVLIVLCLSAAAFARYCVQGG